MRPCGWRCSFFSCDATRKIFFHSPSDHSFGVHVQASHDQRHVYHMFLLYDFSYLPGESVLSLVTLAMTYTIGGQGHQIVNMGILLSSQRISPVFLPFDLPCYFRWFQLPESSSKTSLSLFFFQPQASALMVSRISI